MLPLSQTSTASRYCSGKGKELSCGTFSAYSSHEGSVRDAALDSRSADLSILVHRASKLKALSVKATWEPGNNVGDKCAYGGERRSADLTNQHERDPLVPLEY